MSYGLLLFQNNGGFGHATLPQWWDKTHVFHQDTAGEVSNGLPHPTPGRDKSGPYAPDIASLVRQGHFATNIHQADVFCQQRAPSNH